MDHIFFRDTPVEYSEYDTSEEDKESSISHNTEEDSSEDESYDICAVLEDLHRCCRCISIDLIEPKGLRIDDIVFFEELALSEGHTSCITDTIDESAGDDDVDVHPISGEYSHTDERDPREEESDPTDDECAEFGSEIAPEFLESKCRNRYESEECIAPSWPECIEKAHEK